MNQDQMVRVLAASPLFDLIHEEEIPSFLECLRAKTRSFGRGSTIFTIGDEAQMGLVLSGELRIQTEDLEGRQSILAVLKAPDLFGEVFALSQTRSSVTAFTEVGCEILFLDTGLLTAVCDKACSFHRQFIWNLLNMVAQKNVALNRKLQCVSQRTTREKVEAFLQGHRTKAGTDSFTIPFNREEMADYLCVERSALSAVLSQMKRDKIITYQKNRFQIMQNRSGKT